jgi:hypothetical protein
MIMFDGFYKRLTVADEANRLAKFDDDEEDE